MTEIIIIAKKKAGWLSRVFSAPGTAILLITNAGDDDDEGRIFLSDTHGDVRSLKNIVDCRPVMLCNATRDSACVIVVRYLCTTLEILLIFKPVRATRGFKII